MNATTSKKHIALTIPCRWRIRSAATLSCLLAAASMVLAKSTLQFTAASYSVNEAAEVVTLTVQRLNDPNSAASLTL